jgi:hypothetical protein
MVTQRPAAITKEALSQASTYIIHNLMQTRDLIAIKDQISYGTDKARIDRLVDGIAFAQSGECIIYSPEFLKDDGFLWIGKVRADRRTEHKGKNIVVTPQKDVGMHTTYDIVEGPKLDIKEVEFNDSFNTFSTEVTPISHNSKTDWMSTPDIESNLIWAPPPNIKKTEEVEESNPYTFALVLTTGFFATSALVLHLFTRD